MNRLLYLSHLLLIGIVVIDACKKKQTCSYQVCEKEYHQGYQYQDFNKVVPNSCVIQTNKAIHTYRPEYLPQKNCPGMQQCSLKDLHRKRCRCEITTMKDTHWSEWHKIVTTDGSCKMKRVMNQQYIIFYQIRDNRCLNHKVVPDPEKEFKAC